MPSCVLASQRGLKTPPPSAVCPFGDGVLRLSDAVLAGQSAVLYSSTDSNAVCFYFISSKLVPLPA